MPTLKNSASINSNSPYFKMFQVLIKEEKLMRFQYVEDKDTKFNS